MEKYEIGVYGTEVKKIYVDACEFLTRLKERELGGYFDWVEEHNGKFFHCYDSSAGCHTIERKEEITKELYDFVVSLNYAIGYISKKKH